LQKKRKDRIYLWYQEEKAKTQKFKEELEDFYERQENDL
jgi:hypothetical protein